MTTTRAVTIVDIACLAVCARADTIDLDISSLVNADLTTYTGGANYPQHGGALTVAGIPFTLAICGTKIGELDFVGASSTYACPLTEGANVRDHFDGAFCNTVTNVAGTASFGGGADRLDMQQITLPASFATETLQRIDFKSLGQGGNGSPFLAAADVASNSPVPEPAFARPFSAPC